MKNYLYSTDSKNFINIDDAISFKDMPQGKALVEQTPDVFTEVLAPLGIGYELAKTIPVTSDNYMLVTHWYDAEDEIVQYDYYPIIGWKVVNNMVYPVALGLPAEDLCSLTGSHILDKKVGSYRRVGTYGDSELFQDRESFEKAMMYRAKLKRAR